jgi:transposase-like protein
MSEGSAARFLREVRWSNGVRCIYCSSLSVIGWGWYRCKACLRTFNDKSGTDFEYSRIPLNERLFIAYLSGCLNVPLLRASIDVGRSYGSVYRSFRRIMYAVGRYVRRYWRVSGDVEVDEVYVNAGLKGRGNHDRIILLGRGPRCRGLRAGRGRGGWDKDVIPVFTIIGRDGLRGVEPRTTSDYGGEIGRHASTGREQQGRPLKD